MAVSLFHHPPTFLPLVETATGLFVPPGSSAAGATHASASSSASGRQQCMGLRPSGGGGLPSGGIGKRTQSRRGLSKFFSKARSFASFDEATLCAMCDGKSTARVLAKQQRGGVDTAQDSSCSTSTSVSTTVSAPSSPVQSHRLRRLNSYRPAGRPYRTRSDSEAVHRTAVELLDDESASEARNNSVMAVCLALERACVSDVPETEAVDVSTLAPAGHTDWDTVGSVWAPQFRPTLSAWRDQTAPSEKGTSMEVECT